MSSGPWSFRKKQRALAKTTRSMLAEENDQQQLQHLQSLPSQGEMSRVWEGKSPQLWVCAIEGLLPEPMSFSLNATLGTLPTNSNLCRWGKKSSDTSPLCKGRQTLVHVHNNCLAAINLRRYSRRHKSDLELWGSFIQKHLEPSYSVAYPGGGGDLGVRTPPFRVTTPTLPSREKYTLLYSIVGDGQAH